jgi:protein involved in polysaccharide export with SLBB domain
VTVVPSHRRFWNTTALRAVSVRRALRVAIAGPVLLAGLASGCRVLDERTTSAVNTPGLAILAAFHPSSGETGPVDLAAIKPPPEPSGLEPGDLLECTVWDLFEANQPHTFPVRVTADRSLDLPLAGVVKVTAESPAAVEAQVVKAYRDARILQAPRVVVRSLENATLTVQVTGAVVAPGEVRLSRNAASVFAAIAQTGGLKPNAGRQIGLVRGAVPHTTAPSAAAPVIRGQSPATDAPPEQPEPTDTPAEPTDDSVAATPVTQNLGAESGSDKSPENTVGESEVAHPVAVPSESLPVPAVVAATRRPGQVEWFDLAIPAHVSTLRTIRLKEHDEVIVSTQVAPIRILGSVGSPGPLAGQTDRPRTVASVVADAGGIRTSAWPVVITLYRPPADGQRARQYSWTLADADATLDTAEPLRPGDIIHVAPTTGTRIKSVVGSIWKKPESP